MALLTAAQTTAELQRKAALGLKPTSAANTTQYNAIKAATSPTNPYTANGALPSTLAPKTTAPVVKPTTPTNPYTANGALTSTTAGKPAVASPSAATLAEINRKVSLGLPLADQGNTANAAEYAKQQAAMLAEIQRKAAAGTALTDPNAYKQGLYDQYAANNAAPAPGPAPGPTGTTPTAAKPAAPAAAAPGYTAPTYTPSGKDIPKYESEYNGPDLAGMQKQLDDLYKNRQDSELQKLRDAMETANQGYNSMETQANQSAYDNRNSNDVMSMMQMQAIREQMAAQGTAGGGDSITAQIGNDTARQNGANQINRDQANSLQDISEKRALLANNAAKNELALIQQINSDKAGASLDLAKYGDSRAFDVDQAKYGRFSDDLARQFQQDQFDRGVYEDDRNFGRGVYEDDRNFDYTKGQDQIRNDAQYGGTYNGGLTYQAKQDQIHNDAQYGGTYNGNKTVAQQQQEWNNRFDYGNAIGQFSNGQKTLAAKGQEFDQGMANKNYDRGVFESDRAFDYGKTRDERGDFVDDRNYNRGVFESDRGYNRGVFESNRGFDRGVVESDRNYGLDQDSNDLAWINAANKGGSGSGSQYEGFTANQVLDAVNGQLFDKDGYPKDGSNSVSKQTIYDTVMGYGLPMGQDDQVLMALGLSKADIDAMDKEAFGSGK